MIIQFLLFITNAPFLIGWAKPVPVNFTQLRPKTIGIFLVAFAGPMMNIFLAIIASVLWKTGFLPGDIATVAVQINVILAAFNMLPILPLDGGRMITCFLPQNHPIFIFFERFGMIIIIASLVLFKTQVHGAILFLANMILAFLNMLV